MFRGEELKSEQKLSTRQKETKRERWPKAKRAFHEGRPPAPSNAANMSGQRRTKTGRWNWATWGSFRRLTRAVTVEWGG